MVNYGFRLGQTSSRKRCPGFFFANPIPELSPNQRHQRTAFTGLKNYAMEREHGSTERESPGTALFTVRAIRVMLIYFPSGKLVENPRSTGGNPYLPFASAMALIMKLMFLARFRIV